MLATEAFVTSYKVMQSFALVTFCPRGWAICLLGLGLCLGIYSDSQLYLLCCHRTLFLSHFEFFLTLEIWILLHNFTSMSRLNDFLRLLYSNHMIKLNYSCSHILPGCQHPKITRVILQPSVSHKFFSVLPVLLDRSYMNHFSCLKFCRNFNSSDILMCCILLFQLFFTNLHLQSFQSQGRDWDLFLLSTWILTSLHWGNASLCIM